MNVPPPFVALLAACFILISLFTYSSTLKMYMIYSYEMSLIIGVPDDVIFQKLEHFSTLV
jgi:hypothetical protein